MKEAVRTCVYCIIFAVIFFFMGKCTQPEPEVVNRTFIRTVYDTVRETVPVPERIYITRTDTVFLAVAGDTVYREVVVPVERKEYRTDDYFAVVEGFRPELISMEVYRQNNYITETIKTTKKPRFGIGVQAGYGYSNNKVSPYIGIGIQYNIIGF